MLNQLQVNGGSKCSTSHLTHYRSFQANGSVNKRFRLYHFIMVNSHSTTAKQLMCEVKHNYWKLK